MKIISFEVIRTFSYALFQERMLGIQGDDQAVTIASRGEQCLVGYPSFLYMEAHSSDNSISRPKFARDELVSRSRVSREPGWLEQMILSFCS